MDGKEDFNSIMIDIIYVDNSISTTNNSKMLLGVLTLYTQKLNAIYIYIHS